MVPIKLFLHRILINETVNGWSTLKCTGFPFDISLDLVFYDFIPSD
jgi:hypothetical protein